MPGIEYLGFGSNVKTLEESGLVFLERHEDGTCIVADKISGKMYSYRMGWCLDDPYGMPVVPDLI